MNIILWILQILLGLLFLVVGALKFLMPYEAMVKAAQESGGMLMPHWFILFIGLCEVLGGLGLILPWALKIKPRLTPIAAALLVIIMIGAAVTSAAGGIGMAIFPAVIGVLLALVAWGRSRTSSAV
jgi:uncharacterized membrane protein YphA (DoxX/SURF4 family)